MLATREARALDILTDATLAGPIPPIICRPAVGAIRLVGERTVYNAIIWGVDELACHVDEGFADAGGVERRAAERLAG